MQRLRVIFAFLIIATGMVLMAVISIQNITAISLQFLFFRSVEIPLGVLLAFSFSVGLVLGAITPFVQPIFTGRTRERKGN
jgi:uncharacterized integral membrane protein